MKYEITIIVEGGKDLDTDLQSGHVESCIKEDVFPEEEILEFKYKKYLTNMKYEIQSVSSDDNWVTLAATDFIDTAQLLADFFYKSNKYSSVRILQSSKTWKEVIINPHESTSK